MSIETDLWVHYHVKLTGNSWENKDKAAALLAVHAVDKSFEAEGHSFQEVYGTSSENPLVFKLVSSFDYKGKTYTAGGVTRGPHLIEFANLADATWGMDGTTYRSASTALYEVRNNIVHELGHAFGQLWYKKGASPEKGPYENIPSSLRNSRGFQNPPAYSPKMWRQSSSNESAEIFADMFLGWTFNEWNLSVDVGKTRSEFMTTNMPGWLSAYP